MAETKQAQFISVPQSTPQSKRKFILKAIDNAAKICGDNYNAVVELINKSIVNEFGG